MIPQRESSIDRRLFLGGPGALILFGQPGLAQDAKSEAKPDAKADAIVKRLSDTIADFVVGFDATSLPPLAIERARLAFIDTLAVMLAGSREEGSEIVCEMVRQEGAGPKVSVVGQSFRTRRSSLRSRTALPPTLWTTTCPPCWASRLRRSFRRCCRSRRAPGRRPPK